MYYDFFTYDTDLANQLVPFPHGHSDWVKDGLENQVDQWNFSWILEECWEREAVVAWMQDISLEVPGDSRGTGHIWERGSRTERWCEREWVLETGNPWSQTYHWTFQTLAPINVILLKPVLFDFQPSKLGWACVFILGQSYFILIVPA